MYFDDIFYLILLLMSISLGYFVRYVEEHRTKQLLSTVFGVLLVLAVSGHQIIHPLILTFTNAVIVLYTNKRFCHIISFIFCFLYLIFLRTSAYFGLPELYEFTSTVQMIMTLKMVGLAYEVNICYLLSKSTDAKDQIKAKYQSVQPKFCDVMHYSFCYAGVLIGPYYKYRTYQDMLYCPYKYLIPYEKILMKRFSVVPLYITLYLIFDYLFPLQFLYSDSILEEPLWYRVFYMLPVFFTFRMRMYAAFVLSECICISMGLGAYPEESQPQPGAGPTNYSALKKIIDIPQFSSSGAFNFDTIWSMDEYASEFKPTIREGIRYWNMTVQHWLYAFIYCKTAASKPVKIIVTMLVSAIWHGVRPGYYLSLLGTPLILIAEIEVEKAFRKDASLFQQKLFVWIWYFVKMQSVSYMGMAFLLLDSGDILHYWGSIYFIIHIFTLFAFIISFSKNRLNFTFSNKKEL